MLTHLRQMIQRYWHFFVNASPLQQLRLILVSPLLLVIVIAGTLGYWLTILYHVLWFAVDGLRYRTMTPEQRLARRIKRENEVIERASKMRIVGRGSHPDDHPLFRSEWALMDATEKLVLFNRKEREGSKG
jgi:hypothetical protein